MAAARSAQVGTGERAEKIRTYNFPERRVTDHRIKHTAHNLDQLLAGRARRVHGGAPGRREAPPARRRRRELSAGTLRGAPLPRPADRPHERARRARLRRDRADRGAAATTPRLDAELLLAAAMGVDRAAIVADPGRALEPDAARRFQELRRAPARARAGRLHPRHEGLPLDRARRRPARADPAAGDRAPRRGAARPAARRARVRRRHGLGRDRARAQVRAARPRGRRHGRERRRRSTVARANARAARAGRRRSATATCSRASAGRLDAIASNPPYVEDGAELAPDIVRFEPALALRAGAGRARRRSGGCCRGRRDGGAHARAGDRRRAVRARSRR